MAEIASVEVAVCIEQTLGHRTHGANLERALARGLPNAHSYKVEYTPRAKVLPWAIDGSRKASRILRASGARHGVTMFHTQSIGLFAQRATRGGNYVISVDATPKQLDEWGTWYQHRRSPWLLERGKLAWYRSVMRGAAGLVAWSNWARESLVADYGVSQQSVLVAHPGAPDELFELERRSDSRCPPRILFVGGDFTRKGGEGLLGAFRRLRTPAELVLMTESDVKPEERVSVVRGVRPGSPEFLRCFADADIFCLPTLGDCTPVAIGEAMAAGLAVITTDVGSNRETVPSEAGFVLPPGDESVLAEAISMLVQDRGLRNSMSLGARAFAGEHLSASRNADRVISYLKELAR
jgi:glycosyltransferase involved in cell wall biosynthesis